MARRFDIHVRPGSEQQGEITAVINPNRIRRDGETDTDSPIEQIVSPPLGIDTRSPLIPTWDVPDMAFRVAGERVRVGMEFTQDMVQHVSGESLTETVQEWLSAQGVEIDFSTLRVEEVESGSERFNLRLFEIPMSVEHDAEFNIGVRTTFGKDLCSAPTTASLSLSAGTVDSVCQIIEFESYLFQCTAPAASSTATSITVTAVATGWSNLTANHVFPETIELTTT